MLTARFEAALVYATIVHAGQTRKGGRIPYIGHLLAVTSVALEYGADEDEAIAALLHDAVEDAGGSGRGADIRARFGARVATIVADCSDTEVTPKPPWRDRKEAYIAQLAGHGRSSRFISACDKLVNSRSIVVDRRACGEAVWSRFNGGREGSLWYYQAVLDEFRRDPPHPALIDELARTVAELHADSPAV